MQKKIETRHRILKEPDTEKIKRTKDINQRQQQQLHLLYILHLLVAVVDCW
jgi:hypothetical protein